MAITVRGITSMLSVVLAFYAPITTAVTYDVSASGDDGMGLSEALELAQPGDSIYLADGIYDTALVSYRDGEVDNPITIEGSSDAIINGDYSSRSVLINHSFITLRGFTVEGKIGDGSDSDSYIYKCVYVEGVDSELDGFVMEGMLIQNCGGECIRLKNNVINAELLDNTIYNCGIHDYEFESEDKNGEGIYIGTSSTQWVDDTPDNCIGNIVRGNTIITNGNECVDIKEGSTGNTVEENSCSDQLDTESGCYDVRGDYNIIRYNIAVNCMGAGVRLGGWNIDGYVYGQGNYVYGNDFSNCGVGSIKVETEGQGDICGNTCEGGNCSPLGSESGDIAETWDKACNDNSSNNNNSLSPTPSPSWEYHYLSTMTADDGSTVTKVDDDESAVIVTEDYDDDYTVTEENYYGSTVTKEDDDEYTTNEYDDDESTVTEDDDDESTTTEVDDDGFTVTKEDDDESTTNEYVDEESTVTKVDDDESTTTEVDDDESTVTKDDDESTAVEYDDTSTVTEVDDESTATVTEVDDDRSNVTKEDDDKSMEYDDDGSTVTEVDDDESVTTVTEVDDDGSTAAREDDDESFTTEYDDHGSTVTEEDDGDSSSSTATTTESYENNDGDGKTRRRIRGGRV